MRSWPPASTATVPVARLARCAAASMPRASPETMTKPASPSSRAMRSRELDAGGRGVARADDGDQRPGQTPRVAAHRDQRRRVVDHPQPRRIVRLAERDEARRRALRAASSSRSASSREQMRAGPRRAAAPRQLRQRVERGARAAEMIDQVAEGARPDVVAADQPQPVEPLLVGQLHAVCPRRPRAAASIAQRRRSTTGDARSAGVQRPCADLAFGAGQQPGDVGAVHDPQQRRSAATNSAAASRLAEQPQSAAASARWRSAPASDE